MGEIILCVIFIAIIDLVYDCYKSYKIMQENSEEEFEMRFLEAVWEINSCNHAWVDEAFRRYKEDYESYYYNSKAIAFLEMMEAKDPKIVEVVNFFCNNFYY